MKTTRLLAILLVFAIGVTGFGGQAAQQDKKENQAKPADDAIRISAELVQVDLLVLDKNKRPVIGLKQEDFELFDNEKPQRIGFFSFEESKSQQSPVEQVESRTLPPAIGSGELKRVVAFVVDTLHIRVDNLAGTKKMLTDFIDKQMEPGDLILVMPTGSGSGLYSQFTADQRMLRKAVSSLRQAYILDDSSPARRGSSTQQAVLEDLPTLAENRPGIPKAPPGQGGTIGAEGLEDNDVRVTMSALNSAIQSMGRFSGRKIGVLVSEGIRTFKTHADTLLTDTILGAARANVIFYSIDPSGLDPINFAAQDGQGLKTPLDLSTAQIDPPANPVGSPPPSLPTSTGGTPTSTGTSTGAPGSAIAAKRADVFESQDALLRLANETGGRFYRNNNDIKAGLTSMFAENSSYYLLGFQPEAAKWDGKFHKLRVEVKGRPDLTVMSRKGYLAKTPPAKRVTTDPKTAELMEAMYSPLVRRDIDVQVSPFFKDDSKREAFLSTQIYINASKLTFKEEGGKHTNRLLMTGFLMGANGRVIDQFNNTINLSFEPKDFAEVRKEGLLITRNGPIKPGGYQYRVLVKEADTGLLGTAANYMDVPDMRTDFAMSSIFTDAQLLQQNKAAEAAGGASSMSQRRFPRNGQFAYITIIYNAKKQQDLEMTTRIMRNGQVVFSGKPKPVEVLEGSQLPGRIITGGIMQLASLQPDEYTLEVTIVDKGRKNTKVQQELIFTVE